MSDQISVALLRWIADLCASYTSAARRLADTEINRLASTKVSAQDQKTGVNGVYAQEERTVSTLIESMGLAPPDWRTSVDEVGLPALIRLPRAGWGVVFSRTGSGGYRVDTKDGIQDLNDLPRGTVLATLRSANVSKEPTSAYWLFKKGLMSRKSYFLRVAFASLIANILVFGASLYSMQVYDRVIPTQGLETLFVLTVGAVIAVVMEFIVKIARSGILEVVAKDLDKDLSKQIFERVLRVRLDQFPSSVGTLSAQVRSYETIRTFASSAALFLTSDTPFALLFLLAIYLIGGAYVAAVPVIFFVLAVLVGLVYRKRIDDHASSASSASNQKLGLLVETVDNAEAIKASGAGWQQEEKWERLNQQSTHDDHRVRKYSENAAYFAGLMQQVSYVVLVAVGAWSATLRADFTVGTLIACSILSGRVLAPVAMVPGLIVQWAHAKAALRSLEVVFSLATDNSGVRSAITPRKLSGDLELVGLEFAYLGRDPSLNIPLLRIRAGEKVGILGPVGSGKSTLSKLLTGLYAPTRGSVYLDGLDVQQISRSLLSEKIAYCAQETKLFSGTLRQNLSVGIPGLNDDLILGACRKTGLESFLRSHPMGLDLPIAEGGAGVSGGQKQLVNITRLLLMKPDVWVLDEPTASLDAQAEQCCLKALRDVISTEQTLILITHKPELLSMVDRLVILVGGKLAIDGPRDEVLRALRPQAAVNDSSSIRRVAS